MTAVDLKRAVRMDTGKAFPSVSDFVASCVRLGQAPSRDQVSTMRHTTLKNEFSRALGYD